ncbi:MAG TPA: ATP-binding protein [Thermoanaerobaculia bacterium]|nr:ATP-binding protein [Thermoanaerobaculia bacterium]
MTEPSTETTPQKIRPRDRDIILQSLRAGVVPRRGHQHIQVGRAEEIRTLLRDLERIRDGGSAIRFVIGEYGSGKTFFLFLVRSIALEKGLVTAHADLNPDRRLHATGGQARSLYSELMSNLSTRTKPDGGAVASVVERFVTSALQEARERGAEPASVLQDRLGSLSEMTGGYDFAEVVAAYWRGHDEGNDQLKSDAVRWLRGEFTTRTDARKALGVRTIIDDDNFYDQLKLFARFVRLAGYGGFLVCLDELVNLYKLSNTQARNSNYEQLLRILNDSLQGGSVGLGFLLGGTPEFLMDTRRGLYSYEALRSRLAQNRFAADGLKDYSGPVLHLANLSPEELYILLRNLRHVYASGEAAQHLLPDDALTTFMEHCSKRLGEAYFRTPRSIIRAFLELLAVLEQNPQASWRELLGAIHLAPDTNPDLDPPGSESGGAATAAGDDDELASFRL